MVSARTALDIDPECLKQAWNRRLPAGILIRAVHKYSVPFSVLAQVKEKTYYYHFVTERPLPYIQRYVYFYRYPLDIMRVQQALSLFAGTHDFRSFCTGDERGTDTIRTVTSISLEYIRRYRIYRVTVIGEKFLRYMIRRLVGAAFAVGANENLNSLNHLCDILHACDPHHSLPTAPAQGLVLRKITYKNEK
jgi:tRNA pseudouridine38-40 synthase